MCPDGKYSLPGADDVGDCNCPNNSISRQNAQYVSECICDSGFYKEFSGLFPLGGWYCRLCQVGEFCFNNTNRTCPVHSTSFGVARSFRDCFCNPGYKNTSVRTELSFCETCPANFYCTGKGSVEACVANALSPSQSQDETRCYCDLGWKGVNNTPCVACQSPTFCYAGLQATCPEGTFSPPLAWDRLNCSCIPGRWGPPGGPCILCSAGKYNLFPGCRACSTTTDVDCELCAVGTASTMLGRNSTCDVCGAGTYSFPANTRGAQTCEPCGSGLAAPPGSGACTACGNGFFAAAGFSACVACSAGTFGAGFVSSCQTCAAGTFSGAGASTCVHCQAGTFSSATGATSVATCVDCQAGTYAPHRASACTNCPANSWASTPQSSRCTANTGFYNLDDSLRAYYPFNQGDFLRDITGMTGNLVASPNSPTQIVDGPFGSTSYSAWLDGNAKQFFTLPSLTLPNSMSICSWFWVSASITRRHNRVFDFSLWTANEQILVAIDGTSDNLRTSTHKGFQLLSGSQQTWAGGAEHSRWRHVCLTLSGTSGNFWLDNTPKPFSMSDTRNVDTLLVQNYIGRSSFWQSN